MEQQHKPVENTILRVEIIDGRTVVIDDDLVDRRFVCVGIDGTAIGWLYGSNLALVFLGNVNGSAEEIQQLIREKTVPGDTIIVDHMAGWEWEKKLAVDGIEGRSGVWKLGS